MIGNLSAVRREIETANGLPNAHYVDPEVFRAESEILLADRWAAISVASEVPEKGDAKPITFLGRPLLLIRGRDGTVRVFENICRHRGMILVDEPRKIEGAIRCPYHSWCYGTDGRLVTTPHVGGPGHNTHESIERDKLGLIEVRCHIWRDVVFVNLSGEARAFEEENAELISRWSEFDGPLHHGGAESTFVLDLATNWKLAVENYCESYHLPWVHPGLNSYSRLEDHYHIEEPGSFSGQGTEVYQQLEGDRGAKFPDFEGLDRKWDTAAEYIALYPNVLLGVHRDHAYAIVLEPVTTDRTREHVHLYYPEVATDEALRKENARRWKEVFVEDVFVVEGMQRGRAAPGFDGGKFSPVMDSPTHCFHAWAANLLDQQRTAAE